MAPRTGFLTVPFTGQMWIAEIGLYHFRARAYNPSTGRFMQADPIGLAGGANLYAYAGNDPVNGRDPSGLSRIPISQSDDVVVTGSREGSDGGTSRARRGDGDFNFPIFVRIGGASSPLDNQDPCNGGFSVNPDAAAGCANADQVDEVVTTATRTPPRRTFLAAPRFRSFAAVGAPKATSETEAAQCGTPDENLQQAGQATAAGAAILCGPAAPICAAVGGVIGDDLVRASHAAGCRERMRIMRLEEMGCMKVAQSYFGASGLETAIRYRCPDGSLHSV